MTKFFAPLRFLAPIFFLFLFSAAAEVKVEDLDTTYSDYLTAIYARQAGDVERATENYLRVLKKDPENQKILEEAYTYFVYTGNFKRALEFAERLQDIDPGNNSSAMILALDAFREEEPERMAAYLEKAKGLGFDSLIGPLMQAWLLAEEGETDAALSAIAPLETNPGFEPFYSEHRAFILDLNERNDEAEAAYLALLARPEVTSMQPVLAYGAFLQRRDRGEEAIKLYKDFQTDVPNNRQLRAAIERYEKNKAPISLIDKPEEALSMALLRAAVQLTRDQAYYPGVVFARFAQFLNPEFDEALLFLGNMLSAENSPGLALEAYEGVDKKGPFGETALLRQALVLSFHNRRDEGLEMVSRYLEDHPDSFDALVSLGDLYRSGEDYAEALPFYERAIATKGAIDSEDWFLLFTRAICYERLGQWQKAEADFLQALEYQPDNADILNYLGYSWIDRGMNLERGREMIEKAVAQEPNNGFILDSLGWAQYLMGEYEEAVKNLERAVTLESADPTINDHLGDAYWKVGREREARFQWDHALKLDPEKDVVERLNDKMKYGLNDVSRDNGSL